jgi:hypothetical protein
MTLSPWRITTLPQSHGIAVDVECEILVVGLDDDAVVDRLCGAATAGRPAARLRSGSGQTDSRGRIFRMDDGG